MHVLASLLLLLVNTEGTAVTGNPVTPLTEEEQVRAVISRLEDALMEKDEILVISCLAENTSARKLNEVEASFDKHVAGTSPPQGKPLVCLQTTEVEIDGNKAVAKVETFSYGNGKRIKAYHNIPLRKLDEGWVIDDISSINAIQQQIGGIENYQEERLPKEIHEELAPVVPEEKKKDKTEHKIEPNSNETGEENNTMEDSDEPN